MILIKHKNKRFWRNKLQNTSEEGQLKLKEGKGTMTSSFSYENYITRIITF